VTTRSTNALIGAAAVAAALTLTACGSSGGSSPSSGMNTVTSGPSVTVHSTSLGSVLADSSGHTLYLLTSDTATKVACTGGCTQIWAPLMVANGAMPQAGTGITGTLGVVTRDANKQITIAGHPLYTYTADDGPGQANGQGINSYGGTWYVLSSSGAAVTTSGGSGASPSPTSGGYTY
jgi:predicted lipoprotein with Yx(FWY)xxD motif